MEDETKVGQDYPDAVPITPQQILDEYIAHREAPKAGAGGAVIAAIGAEALNLLKTEGPVFLQWLLTNYLVVKPAAPVATTVVK